MFELPKIEPKPLKPGLYKIDIFNENPLFVVNKLKVKDSLETNYIVKNWEEAFSLHGNFNISDINFDFIACLISNCESTMVSPYKRIKRLPKSSNVLIGQNGRFNIQKYDFPEEDIGFLNKEQIHYRIRKELKNSIIKEIKAQKNNIGIEHSSGLDSNTILSILLSSKNIGKDKIHTFSLDNSEGESIERCRDHFALSKSNVHVGNENYNNDNNFIDIIHILGAPSFNKRCLERLRILQANNCDIMFSGFGGDQALSHLGLNTLTDLVLKNDFKNIIQWTGNFNQSFKTYLGRHLLRMLPKLKEIKINSFVNRSIFHNILIDCLSNFGKELIYPRIKTKFPVECDIYVKMSESIKSRIYADHLSIRIEEERRLAKFYGIKKIFPLLNKKLIELIINQDPFYFSNKKGNGRLLLRESFKNELPEFLINGPLKYRQINEQILMKNIILLKKDLQMRINSINGFHPYLSKLWDLKKLKQIYEDYLSKDFYLNRDILRLDYALYNLEAINYWFNLIDN